MGNRNLRKEEVLLGPPPQKREFLVLWTFICGESIRGSHRDTTASPSTFQPRCATGDLRSYSEVFSERSLPIHIRNAA